MSHGGSISDDSMAVKKEARRLRAIAFERLLSDGEVMTNEDKGMSALMIPGLGEVSTEQATLNVRASARGAVLAYEAGQWVTGVHEAGHGCGAAALGIPVRVIDITTRFGGSTQTGSPADDTTIPWETSGRMLDGIVVAMCGAAAEAEILGESSSGSESDYDLAVGRAYRWTQAFPMDGILIGQGGLPYGYSTEAIRTATILKIEEAVAAARVRAEALMALHRDALIQVATAVYDKRRLSDERLDEVLRSAGFELPQPLG